MKLPFEEKTRHVIYLAISLIFLWYTAIPLEAPPVVPSVKPRPPTEKEPNPVPVPEPVSGTGTQRTNAFVSKGELKMMEVFKKLYPDAKFRKVRPRWLKNPKTGKPLELDCYSHELKIAGEYNGEQHYKYRPFFHRTPEDFQEQVYRDKVKKDMCEKLGITLIVVPYTVKREDMEKYICDQIKLHEATK